ncbi:MAG: glutathione S-transferase family protein [Defluviicoccus sp.]|nr:glutathione S-transferase family protein [Defluviicoccus sp.]
MKVYYAPYTRAVRTVWLLNELGLDYELERYKLGEKAMRSPEYLAVNPNGRVPTLDDGDTRMSESTAIAQYLVARYGDGSLARSPDSPDFAAYLQWLHYGEGMIMPPINTIVVETLLLPPERRSQPHADRALRLLSRTLGPVEAHLKGREYLAGSFSVADTITGHACIMAEKRGADLSDKPNLKAYNERLLARPALEAAWDA